MVPPEGFTLAGGEDFDYLCGAIIIFNQNLRKMSKFILANSPSEGGIYLNVDNIVCVKPHGAHMTQVITNAVIGGEYKSYYLNGSCDEFFRTIGVTPVEF